LTEIKSANRSKKKLLSLLICKKNKKCLLKSDIMQFTPKNIPLSEWIFLFFSLVICSAGDDLFAGRPEQDGVLELGRVAALDVTQWRVRLNDSLLGEILQRHLQHKDSIRFKTKWPFKTSFYTNLLIRSFSKVIMINFRDLQQISLECLITNE
jgi:hypothetical protein